MAGGREAPHTTRKELVAPLPHPRRFSVANPPMHSALRRAASLPSIVLAASFLATAHAQAAERCPATVVNRDSAGTRDSPLQLVSGCLNSEHTILCMHEPYSPKQSGVVCMHEPL